jgi:DNA-binding SARP family transcriptional activator
MEFSLLGPLAVRSSGQPVPIPAGKQRAVLATLLLSANHPVSLDELAATLWGVDPPPSARVSVQNYVMRLRKALAATGEPRITTQPGGYVLRVAPGELRDGRQADALAAYQSLRRTLVAELAAEPAAELRQLHQQMLTADPVLAAPGTEASPAATGTAVPRELPPTVRPSPAGLRKSSGSPICLISRLGSRLAPS